MVGGGPAPGINAVIAAATIQARNSGCEVVGILDGYRWLSHGDISHVRMLQVADVSRIHFRGGSILRTSRANPTRHPHQLEAVAKALRQLEVRALLSIGGDDTAYTASQLLEVDPDLRIAHVPKTIDNDLPLPPEIPTFGFETARHCGVSIVERIMEDALTTGRWYVLVAMGRKAGHLALGIGKAAGATLTLIPEEFARSRLSLSQLADLIEGSMIVRRAAGREDGVVVLAEGLAECLDPAELGGLEDVDRDDHGHVRLSELPLGPLLKTELRTRLGRRGIDLKIVSKDIGYELRCADPIPFDSEYARDLGYGAACFLLAANGSAMITRQGGRILPVPLDSLRDPATGRTRIRLVDVESDSFVVAGRYMIRLRARDLEDPIRAAALAEAGGTTVEALRELCVPFPGNQRP
ncbi:MAG: diphosphate--fructose-6-phosphate 1-phosphotransferase [Myxococcota bacterium]